MMTINTPFKSGEKSLYTIALIDSDRSINHQLAAYLRHIGWKVIQAFSSDEIPLIVAQNPDFMVIDPIYGSCDEFKLCDYLRDPLAAGVVVFSSDSDPKRRTHLFECGILEYFSKDEPLEYAGEELIRLFETIQNNPLYHVTIIGNTESSKEKIRQVLLHRKYRLSFLPQVKEIHQNWQYHNHKLPDLLVLDLKSGDNLEEVFELVRYIRIHRLSEMPIIILFDTTHPNLFSKLYRMGVNNILSESFSAEKLLSKVIRHLDYRIDKKLLQYEQNLSSQLKTMIDSSSIVSKTDSRGIITYVNEQFSAITGYTKEELIGKPHNIIRHPDTSPLFFEQMWKTIQSKKIFHGMIMNLRKDGSTYYVDSTIAPVLDDNGMIIEYISIRHDITALIEKQHEIEEQRRRIKNVLDAQTSLICMVDKIKGIVQSNRRFMEFLGIENLNPEHLGFQNLHELFLDIDNALQIKNGERYVWLEHLYEMRHQFVKVAIKDHNCNHHIFSIHVEKIADPSFTEEICYLVSFEDVTELNYALREAKAASEAESRFLATMSHEIRTPLNGILGFAELLLETPMDEEQKKYLQAIAYSGETLRQIINDILHIMKLDREKLELQNAKINLIGELEALIYPFYAQAAKKMVDLLVFIDPQLPVTIETDILHLKQILINLIGNAIKFTPEGKTITVRIKKLKEISGKVKIGFTVADEGIGIKPEHKERIFNAFVQADNSIAREYGGTGLGLNILLRVVSAMGGKIALKSMVGKGSVFHTTLEFAAEPAHYPYECRQHITYLYLPVSETTPRFRLIERYLNRFECCEQSIQRIRSLDQIEDRTDLSLVLFMDMMDVPAVARVKRSFTLANLYCIPSFMSNIAFLPLVSNNLFWINHELSWSTLAKGFNIYHPKKLLVGNHARSTHFLELRVLVAEDNEVNRFYIQEILKKLGITFEIAHDGYEAVKKFIHSKFDLVLMDINMPNLDGITAAQQILHYEQETGAPHTPIIGLSADAVEKNIKHYITQGLDGYLVKPVRKSDLANMFKELFEPDSDNALPASAEPDSPFHTVEEADESLITSVAVKLELPETIVMELFRKFINNAQTLLQQIQENRRNPDNLMMALHSLKGISKNLYLEPLGNHCHEFEALFATTTEDEKGEWIEKISLETEMYIHRMQKELNG